MKTKRKKYGGTKKRKRTSSNSDNMFLTKMHNRIHNGFTFMTKPDLVDAIHSYMNGETKFGEISTWNVSNISDMDSLFSGIANFNIDINSWDVSNVITMKSMFSGCSIFNQPLDQWNVSNVRNMESMFSGCIEFNQPLENSTHDDETMNSLTNMFANINIKHNNNGWNVSNVTNMKSMFYDCFNFNQPLGRWDVSNVTNMESMFYGCMFFNQNLSKWDVQRVNNYANFNEFCGLSELYMPDFYKYSSSDKLCDTTIKIKTIDEPNFPLVVLENCYPEQKIANWKGVKRSRYTNMGCGISTLTFLGEMSYQTANMEIANLSQYGTTIDFIVKWLNNKIGTNQFQKRYESFNIHNKQSRRIIQDIYKRLFNLMPTNSCIIVRYEESENGNEYGHSMVLTKYIKNTDTGSKIIFARFDPFFAKHDVHSRVVKEINLNLDEISMNAYSKFFLAYRFLGISYIVGNQIIRGGTKTNFIDISKFFS